MASVSTAYSRGVDKVFLFVTLWRQENQERPELSCPATPVATQEGQAKKAFFVRYFFSLNADQEFSCTVTYMKTTVAEIGVEQGEVIVMKTRDADKVRFHVYDKKFAQL